ncbi:MAG: biotin/lipoyl-containing protein [Pseudomonadota bacterium]
MTTFQFNDKPDARHRVTTQGGAIQVGATSVSVRAVGGGSFASAVNGRNERLQAVAHGDAIFVQLKGRAWRLERIDPLRSASAAASGGAGSLQAPMPGVVVSLLVQHGQQVKEGDALLVIESMKLQMTISAPLDGAVTELPFAAGQTFQRGAVLARVDANGEQA